LILLLLHNLFLPPILPVLGPLFLPLLHFSKTHLRFPHSRPVIGTFIHIIQAHNQEIMIFPRFPAFSPSYFPAFSSQPNEPSKKKKRQRCKAYSKFHRNRMPTPKLSFRIERTTTSAFSRNIFESPIVGIN